MSTILYEKVASVFGLSEKDVINFPELAASADPSEIAFRTQLLKASQKEILANMSLYERLHEELDRLHSECVELNLLLGTTPSESVCKRADEELREVFASKRLELRRCDRQIDEIQRQMNNLSTYQRAAAKKALSTLTPTAREQISTEIPELDF